MSQDSNSGVFKTIVKVGAVVGIAYLAAKYIYRRQKGSLKVKKIETSRLLNIRDDELI